MSRTRKLITQIKQVCEEICNMKLYSPNKKNHSPPSNYRKNMGHPPDICEKDEEDYTCSTDNKKHVRCEVHKAVCTTKDIMHHPLLLCHFLHHLPH